MNTAYLSLDRNVLHSIPRNAFKNLPNLVRLDLSNSHIYNLESGAFNNLSQLNILKLKNNYLCENNGSHAECVSGAVFSHLASLKVLDVSNNRKLVSNVADVAHGLRNTSIEELYMTNTCLGVDNVVEGMLANLKGTNIKVLALDENEIHNVTYLFTRLPHIEMLMLANNGIQSQNMFDLFKDIFNAKHLKKLDLNNQKFILQSSCGSDMSSRKPNLHPAVSQLKGFNFCNYSTSCSVL